MDNRKDILMGWEETGKKENAFSKESDFESDNNAHLISAIDTAAALKELLAAEPDNLQAKMLYGTCRQLLGDEETFRRIIEAGNMAIFEETGEWNIP